MLTIKYIFGILDTYQDFDSLDKTKWRKVKQLIYSRRSDCSVSFLSCCVPDLSLDSLAFDLDVASSKLYPDGALALQIKFITGESG